VKRFALRAFGGHPLLRFAVIVVTAVIYRLSSRLNARP